MQRAFTNLDGDQVTVPEAEVQSLPQPKNIILGNILVRLEPCGEQMEAFFARVAVRRAECSNETGILQRVRRGWLQNGLIPRLLLTNLLPDLLFRGCHVILQWVVRAEEKLIETCCSWR